MNIAKYTDHVALSNNQSRMESSTYVINVCLKNVIFLSVARYTEAWSSSGLRPVKFLFLQSMAS